ncbi:hypothetical protein PROFUN_00447 [Planoprotostelium fungivorum]|uniref:Uncharacterized protein n=1 Tax=Planoprotostelium fungivorum TaxID=1890364 RepID=A0A2P6N0V9_9EUKA|nr:hypothetical protein PROFUN_00447 [Planoprotostelium fungivorum]
MTMSEKPFKLRKWTLLHDAISQMDNDLVIMLLIFRILSIQTTQLLDANAVNQRAPTGDTPLHLAMALDYEQGVDLLLNHGANPNIFAGPQQLTPASIAIISGKLKSLKKLIDFHKEKGVSSPFQINQSNDFGDTALHYACSEGVLDAVMWLVDAGANINSHEKGNCTPLKKAREKKHTKIVEYLKERGGKKISHSWPTTKPPQTLPPLVTDGWHEDRRGYQQEQEFGGSIHFNRSETFYCGKKPKELLSLQLHIQFENKNHAILYGITSWVAPDAKSFRGLNESGTFFSKNLSIDDGEWEGHFTWLPSLRQPWLLTLLKPLTDDEASMEILTSRIDEQIEKRGRKIPPKYNAKIWIPLGLEEDQDEQESDEPSDVMVSADISTDEDCTMEIIFENGSIRRLEGESAEQMLEELITASLILKKKGKRGFVLRMDGAPMNNNLPVRKEEASKMQSLKCVVVGDGAVGKTCLLMAFSSNLFPQEYVPTVFDNYNSAIMIDKKPYNLGLWDTAGQEEYDRLRALCYPQTDVFLVCFSVVNPSSYDNIKLRWLPELSHLCPGTPTVLVGTKIDLRDDPTTIESLKQSQQEPITTEKGEQLSREMRMNTYMEVSALTQKNLRELFEKAATIVIDQHPSKAGGSATETKKKSKGCTIL